MATKVLTVEQFKKLVEGIALEEARTLLSEEDPGGGLSQTKREMAEWIIRQWFSPKNQGKPWYQEGVTPENVFDVIFDPDSRFPYNKTQLLDMFDVKKTVGGVMSKSLPDVPLGKSAVTPGKKSQMMTGNDGGMGLKDIASTMGTSHQRIDQIYQGAADKIRKMTGGKHPAEMHDVDVAGFTEEVDQVRSDVAEEFAAALGSSGGNVSDFLVALGKSKVLTPEDIKNMPDVEVRAWMELAGKTPEVIEAILKTDIEEDDNLFKAFQQAVARRYNKQYMRAEKPSA